jgi:hypothetical protein
MGTLTWLAVYYVTHLLQYYSIISSLIGGSSCLVVCIPQYLEQCLTDGRHPKRTCQIDPGKKEFFSPQMIIFSHLFFPPSSLSLSVCLPVSQSLCAVPFTIFLPLSISHTLSCPLFFLLIIPCLQTDKHTLFLGCPSIECTYILLQTPAEGPASWALEDTQNQGCRGVSLPALFQPP